MNLTRLRSLEAGLNGQARKVYDCLPITTDVTLREMMSILAGIGQRPDIRVVEGCLNDFVERGLAVSRIQGRWQRKISTGSSVTEVVLDKNSAGVKYVDATTINVAVSPKLTPFEELAILEERLQAATKAIGSALQDLAEIAKDLAAASIHVADHIKAVEGKHAKLDALKAALRDLQLDDK